MWVWFLLVHMLMGAAAIAIILAALIELFGVWWTIGIVTLWFIWLMLKKSFE